MGRQKPQWTQVASVGGARGPVASNAVTGPARTSGGVEALLHAAREAEERRVRVVIAREGGANGRGCVEEDGR